MSSGIDELKKKTKLSIDEMYDNKSVGKVDSQLYGKTEKKQDNLTERNIVGNMNVHQDVNPSTHMVYRSQTPKQQTIKEPTYKMTFNLPKDVYKAFNDVYAQRMLNGCKTEKSELICEAIQLLIQVEKE